MTPPATVVSNRAGGALDYVADGGMRTHIYLDADGNFGMQDEGGTVDGVAGALVRREQAPQAIKILQSDSDSSELVSRKSPESPSDSLNDDTNLERDCLGGLGKLKASLRRDGDFPIPPNGENVDFVEGGSPDDAFTYLGRVVRKELARAHASSLTSSQGQAQGVVCQTGFNYGTSAYAFLCMARAARVFSWDLGYHDYVSHAEHLLLKEFPGRHNLSLGDSRKTLPKAVAGQGPMHKGEQCDVAFVDGGHYQDITAADIDNFARLSTPGALLLVDDCSMDGGGMAGAAFHEALQAGKVVKEDDPDLKARFEEQDRDVCVGRFPQVPADEIEKNKKTPLWMRALTAVTTQARWWK